MKTLSAIVASLMVGLILTGCAVKTPQKFAIILQAGTETHEGLARALHAMLYAKELKEKGHPVVLIFDGAGTEWAEALEHPDNKLHPIYEQLKQSGITEIVCDFCSTAFKVKPALEKVGAHFDNAYNGHPSIAKWVNQGYQLLVL